MDRAGLSYPENTGFCCLVGLLRITGKAKNRHRLEGMWPVWQRELKTRSVMFGKHKICRSERAGQIGLFVFLTVS